MTAIKKPRAKPRHIEDALQVAVIQYLRVTLSPSVLFWHTPNGGKRNAREAGRLKAMGVLPGVPDIILTWNSFGRPFIMGIELKSKDGRHTDNQKDIAQKLNAMGWYVVTARSIDEVQTYLTAAVAPMRGQVTA